MFEKIYATLIRAFYICKECKRIKNSMILYVNKFLQYLNYARQ